MVLTRAERRAALTHIIENVFLLDADNLLRDALNKACYFNIYDILAMLPHEIELLDYEDDHGRLVKLPNAYKSKLRAIKHYDSYQTLEGNPIGDDWKSVTANQYDKYRISATYAATPNDAPFHPKDCPGPSSFHHAISNVQEMNCRLQDVAAIHDSVACHKSNCRLQDVTAIDSGETTAPLLACPESPIANVDHMKVAGTLPMLRTRFWKTLFTIPVLSLPTHPLLMVGRLLPRFLWYQSWTQATLLVALLAPLSTHRLMGRLVKQVLLVLTQIVSRIFLRRRPP
jgi:hypothetical protein